MRVLFFVGFLLYIISQQSYGAVDSDITIAVISDKAMESHGTPVICVQSAEMAQVKTFG